MSLLARGLTSALVSRSVAPDFTYYTSVALQAQYQKYSSDAASTSPAKSDEKNTSTSSIAPDAFLSHLQHKTENDLLDLLSQKDKDSADDEAEGDEQASAHVESNRMGVMEQF